MNTPAQDRGLTGVAPVISAPRSVFKSRTARYCAIAFASIPVLALLASMTFNAMKFGTPFTASGEWNNFPLWIATMPFNVIADFLYETFPGFQSGDYFGVILYTLITAILYAAIGYLLGLGIRAAITGFTKRKAISH